jgi:hypothetical protein
VGFIDGRVNFTERTDFITDLTEDFVFCFVNSKEFSVKQVESLTNTGGGWLFTKLKFEGLLIVSDSLDLNELRWELFPDFTETVEKSDFTTEFLKLDLLLTSDSGARLKLLLEPIVEFTKEAADLTEIGTTVE